MKIAYLSDFPFSVGFGGKEIQMLSYLNQINLAYKNIKIELFNFHDLSFLKDKPILHIFGNSSWFYTIVKIIKEKYKNIKIVCSPTLYLDKKGLLKFKIGKYFRSTYFNHLYNLLTLVDKIIVNSEAEREQIIFIMGDRFYNKIDVIRNAIESDFNKFYSDTNKELFIKKYGLNKGEYILSVGFLDDRKNSLNMVKAYLQAYNIIKKKLVIIGDFRFFSKNMFNLKSLLEQHKDKIIHIPYIDRNTNIDLLKSAYYNCSYHILPSFIETPGISNLEAASFGKKILVGDCPPVREYFKDLAVYCIPKNIESIKEAIIKTDKLSEDVGEHLQQLVMSNYTYEIVVNKLVQIYEELL